jgi:hypothetical protein
MVEYGSYKKISFELGENKMAAYISYEQVTETWEKMVDTPVEEAQRLVSEMESGQPFIMLYLLDKEDSPFDQTESEIIFYLGTVLWQVMEQGEQPLNRVEVEDIIKAEESNYQFLDQISSDTDADFISATREMIESFSEPEVLRYLVEAILEGDDDFFEEFGDSIEVYDELEEGEWEDDFEEDEEDATIRPENRGLAFIELKTVLDAMIAKRGESPRQE